MSVRHEESEKIACLDAAADDYLTKPFRNGRAPCASPGCLAEGFWQRPNRNLQDRQPQGRFQQARSECRYVLENLGEVYHNDALSREKKMSPEERLVFHQEHSGPVMERLKEWLTAQLAEHRTEPNSGLGKAISYLQRHWTKLRLFLRQPGAPLDNNIVERAMKKAILHRKNALFYKTMNGARVGDLFMSLIHTCELNKVNPFDYLTELLRHPAEVAMRPAEWMPWNYRRETTAMAA
jgi:CheY-like chemotaxis protein